MVLLAATHPVKRSSAAGHRNIPSNATLKIHVQSISLGPQTRALVNNLEFRALSRALSHEEWHRIRRF
jgi:hypothetical protein